MLVDKYLAAHASHTPCIRTDIRDAFAYLTNPRIAQALWTDDRRTAIVVLAPLSRTNRRANRGRQPAPSRVRPSRQVATAPHGRD